MDAVKTILVDALYLLVLINPISKISVLAVLSSQQIPRRTGL